MKYPYLKYLLGFTGLFVAIAGCDKSSTNPPIADPVCDLTIIYPKSIGENQPFPIVVEISDQNPRYSIWEWFEIECPGTSVLPEGFFVKRGRGSVTVSGGFNQDFSVDLASSYYNSNTNLQINIDTDADYRDFSGILSGDDLFWDSASVIRITADVSVPAGSKLVIAPGTRIELDHLVNITVEGEIEAAGNIEAPIYITSGNESQPWGEIDHQNSFGDYKYTFLINGGGDPNRSFGHSDSQPVIAGDNCSLTLDHVYIIDNPGKAFGLSGSEIQIEHSLVSRCDTGGEFAFTLVNISDSYFIDMPNGDDIEADDDNDGMYLLAPWSGGADTSLIENCVFVSGKDDAIDHNMANVLVSGCVIEDFDNEGVACSNDNFIEIYNTLVLGCEQGIEAGYGEPTVKVNHCTLLNNETGLRFGDWYNWGCFGNMTVKNTISHNNILHNVWNYDVQSNGPKAGAITILYSLVNEAEYDTCNGCVTGSPAFTADFLLQPESPGSGSADDGLDMGITQ